MPNTMSPLTLGSAWAIDPSETTKPNRSVMGSIRSFGRKKSTASQSSQRTNTSTSNNSTSSISNRFSTLNPFNNSQDKARNLSPNPMGNPSPSTRRPSSGVPAFGTASTGEAPPAYTATSPTTATGSNLTVPSSIRASELIDSSAPPLPSTANPATGEDPYGFLSTFDTVLLIDDSGSMTGRSWRETSQAIGSIAPIITKHDADGIDVFFLNHKSNHGGSPSEGIAPGGYRGIRRTNSVKEIFESVRPYGGTPTGIRIHHILKPYLAKLESEMSSGREMKPLNLIVITDGVPTDDVESVIISAAKKLDKLDAPPFQVGIQFFQVGNEQGAKEALEELDDGLSEFVEGGVRDIVDTVTWTGGVAASEGGVGLTGDQILKAVLGAVVKRLDRRRASGEVRRR